MTNPLRRPLEDSPFIFLLEQILFTLRGWMLVKQLGDLRVSAALLSPRPLLDKVKETTSRYGCEPTPKRTLASGASIALDRPSHRTENFLSNVRRVGIL